MSKRSHQDVPLELGLRIYGLSLSLSVLSCLLSLSLSMFSCLLSLSGGFVFLPCVYMVFSFVCLSACVCL